GCMLPLLSISRPTVTGASWLRKNRIGCGRLSSSTPNASCVRSDTYAPVLSLMDTWRTTKSDCVENSGCRPTASGDCGARDSDAGTATKVAPLVVTSVNT